jgi:hypothetical protein
MFPKQTAPTLQVERFPDFMKPIIDYFDPAIPTT